MTCVQQLSGFSTEHVGFPMGRCGLQWGTYRTGRWPLVSLFVALLATQVPAWAQETSLKIETPTPLVVGDQIIVESSGLNASQIEMIKQAAVKEGQEATSSQPPGTEDASGEASGGDKKAAQPTKQDGSEAAKNIQRSDEPPPAANPQELSASPNPEGLLEFQFRNQPWPAVLNWLAKVSDLSLDWLELPGDTINLSTRRPYTLEETQDHINRALLMRGFTLLESEGALTVAKTQDLNPSIVPRVRPEELTSLPPHSYVRTSFELEWLLAEDLHEEFASMLSKNGKLIPLVSTNRLEGMDAVANLREIHDILTKEQSAIAMANLAEEFKLVHARASQVKTDLEQFLGISNSGSSAAPPGDPNAAMMMQQMQQQMQAQQQQMQQQLQSMQQPGASGGAKRSPRQRSDKIFLVANDRSNTLIVHAPPNKRAIVAAFIKRVDVPNEMASDFERMKLRTKVFRLISLSPRELVASLTAMDVLEPATRLQINEENRSVIAYASIPDQYLIQQVIDRLDGSQRSMHVIQLRRLNADSVAGSVRFLMGGDEEENQNQSRGYYDPWSFNSRNSSSSKKSDKMRVTANVQDNQLLLWVNQIELDEVNGLLVRLGEIRPEGGPGSNVRVIDASRRPETFEYLKRLKQQWDKISPNPLMIPDESEFQTQTEETGKADEPPKAAPAAPAPLENITYQSRFDQGLKLTSAESNDAPAFPDTDHQTPEDEQSSGTTSSERDLSTTADDGSQSDKGPAISIMIDDRGNLILRSEDVAALDQLEQWMMDHRPPRREYDVFTVKFARASWVCLNLKEYFAKQKEDQSNRGGFFFWDFDYNSRNNKKQDEQQLGKRPELQFIYDNDTNTIVVKNADDRDRATIAELIKLWDVPDPKEKSDKETRFTKLVALRYSRATYILNTVKEAYRDLLSANDKTFEKDTNGENKREGGSGFSMSFKGKLSLGADEVSNRILVSAEGEELLKVVCDMIEELDLAAADQGVIQVVSIGEQLNAKSLEEALRGILSPPPQPNNKPNPQAAQDEAAAQAQAQAAQNEAAKNGARNNVRISPR